MKLLLLTLLPLMVASVVRLLHFWLPLPSVVVIIAVAAAADARCRCSSCCRSTTFVRSHAAAATAAEAITVPFRSLPQRTSVSSFSSS